ncbi:hypothetical protein BGP_6604 [Beggiatoa sp. PS]|nr:hypothetical protein BGP_6604 [Beggiatoa sp. PS]
MIALKNAIDRKLAQPKTQPIMVVTSQPQIT